MTSERSTFSESLTKGQRTSIVAVYWLVAICVCVALGPWIGTWVSYNLMLSRSYYFEAYTVIEAWLAAAEMWPIALAATFLLFAVFYMIFKSVWSAIKEKKKTPIRERIPERQKSAEHGDSWPMEKWQMRANGIMWFYPQKGYTEVKSKLSNIPKKHKEFNEYGIACPPRFGMVIGHSGEAGSKEECYVLSPEGHSMTLSKTGGKKTRDHVMQTIHLKLGLRLESAVIPDEKLELYRTCAPALKKTHTVRKIDLSTPALSDGYNIMDEINYLIDCGEVGKAESLAAELGMNIVTASDDKEVNTWKEAAAGLINAIVLLLSMRGGEDERCGSNAFKFLRRFSPDRTIIEKRGKRLVETQVNLMDEIFNSLGEENPNDPAYLTYGTAAIAQGRTASSIGFSTSNALQVFANSELQEIGTKSSFNLEDIGNEPFVLFVSIPHETKAFKVFYSVLISQVYQALVRSAKENGGRLKNTVTFMLEEWGVTPIIEGLPERINIGRGLDIWFAMFAQEKDMVHRYDRGRASAESTILGACNTIIYKSSNCPKTHQYISRRLNNYTILKEADSESSRKASISPFDGQVSKNQSKAPRPYHTPDEIAELDPAIDGSLVFFGGGFGWFHSEDLSLCSSNEFFGMPAPTGCEDTDKEATQAIFRERTAAEQPVGQKMPKEFNAFPLIPQRFHSALTARELASYKVDDAHRKNLNNEEAYQEEIARALEAEMARFEIEASKASTPKEANTEAQEIKPSPKPKKDKEVKEKMVEDKPLPGLTETTPIGEVLAAIEVAEAKVERLRESGELPPGVRTRSEIAKMLGKSQGWIGQRKGLTNLIPALQEALDKGEIGLGRALELAKLNEAEQVKELVELEYELNPKEVEYTQEELCV